MTNDSMMPGGGVPPQRPDPLRRIYDRPTLVTALNKAARYHERVSLEYATLLPDNYSGLDLSQIAGEGLTARFCNLTGCNFQQINLSHANLGGSLLTDADLSGADCNHVEMRGVVLCRARCVETNFSWADLSGAYLVSGETSLLVALLMNANLTDADLRLASLRGAHCLGANFMRCDLAGAVFAQAEYDPAALLLARGTDAVIWQEYVIPDEGEFL